MSTQKPKRFEYAVEVERDGRMRADGEAEVSLPEAWSPDHLLLAALVTCVLTSLDYHARRAGIEVTGWGSAQGVVTKRETDGRFAFVEIEADLEASFSPPQEGPVVQELLEKAERDCFVGSSLTVKPTYRWTVA